MYACLYEHPEICAPVKEIHFFSRPRFEKGLAWYESHFNKCAERKKRGEFSTSYLYSPESAERIALAYPEVKLIAILRNPVTRAISQHTNAIKAGEIRKDETFEMYSAREKSVIAQGLYFEQLQPYLARFKREQILVLIYEDSKKDSKQFMERIYRFLGVSSAFVPSMLYSEINTARVPRMVFVERLMHHTAEGLRKIGLDALVHFVRTKGIPDLVRSFNTETETKKDEVDTKALATFFVADTKKLSELLERDMVSQWNLV